MIVAGEASGDGHAAKLVRALRESPAGDGLAFFGAAGPKMREAGVEAVVAADELSIVGLLEIAGALPMFLKAFRRLTGAAKQRNPSVVILVDFPDFNLKLAKSLKCRGHTIVYYISPQLWAWRKYRIATIRKYVDLLLTILPFEKAWFEAHGVEHVEYVGSPLVREVHPTGTREEFCEVLGLKPDGPLFALLPGSRAKEISRILPVLLDTAVKLCDKIADAQFVIPVPAAKQAEQVQRLIAERNVVVNVRTVTGETYDALLASDVAAVTSGTATLETAIIGTPMVVLYKTSALNYALLEPLISVDHYGLVNLIAGERLATELIQGDLSASGLAKEMLRLYEPSENAQMRAKLKDVAAKLGSGGASKRAAEFIVGLIEERDASGGA